jgi:hypothetical protein
MNSVNRQTMASSQMAKCHCSADGEYHTATLATLELFLYVLQVMACGGLLLNSMKRLQMVRSSVRKDIALNRGATSDFVWSH